MFGSWDLDSIIRNPTPWLMICLLFIVFWLVRAVTDYRKEVTVYREETTHAVTPEFLAHFTSINNRRQLKRIQGAYRRANIKGGSNNFDFELQREINLLKTGERNQGNDSDDENDQSNENDNNNNNNNQNSDPNEIHL